jgi:hypothetical protein
MNKIKKTILLALLATSVFLAKDATLSRKVNEYEGQHRIAKVNEYEGQYRVALAGDPSQW